MVKLYHYTSQENARQILNSGYIKAQSPHGGHAPGYMPKGVYLTSIPPKQHQNELILNNYDDGRRILHRQDVLNKVQFVFEVHTEDLPGVYPNKHTDRNEWIYTSDIPLYVTAKYAPIKLFY